MTTCVIVRGLTNGVGQPRHIVLKTEKPFVTWNFSIVDPERERAVYVNPPHKAYSTENRAKKAAKRLLATLAQ